MTPSNNLFFKDLKENPIIYKNRLFFICVGKDKNENRLIVRYLGDDNFIYYVPFSIDRTSSINGYHIKASQISYQNLDSQIFTLINDQLDDISLRQKFNY